MGTQEPDQSVSEETQSQLDKICIVEDGNKLSYREWEQQANKLANALALKGVQANHKVAVRTQTRTQWFIINRALAKLGAEHIALNWRLTPSEFTYIVKDSEAKALFFDDEDADAFAASIDLSQFSVVVSLNKIDHPQVENFDAFVSGGADTVVKGALSAPLVLYTSGTTGRPKGAVQNKKKLLENMTQVLEYRGDIESKYKAAGKDLAIAKNSHSMATLLTLPLHHGAGPMAANDCFESNGTLYLLRKFDPETALQLIAEHRILNWTAVPTMLFRIIALPEEILKKYDVSSLRALRIGAAPMPFALKQKSINYFGHCLTESYGATEFGLATFLPPQDQLTKPGSCGQPYRHVHIKIVDNQDHELSAGEVGEILVKTPMVIEGYLNQGPLDDKTLDSEGFFRTGDVGYMDNDGYLYITDRKKDMIIAGGVNIYPAEIEAVLTKHPDIVESAVIGIPHEEFGEQVMAICQLNKHRERSEQLTAQEVIDFCSDELSAYKCPRQVVFVDELPRNPIGKVLKNELRDQYRITKEQKI